MLDKLDTFDNHVRERAFTLWEEAGCPDDRAEEFWHRAREVEMQEYGLSEADLKTLAEERSPGDDADFA